jgi:hypothetical protein
MRTLVALLLPLALGACSMTTFKNLPQGVAEDCPKAAVGAWLAREERPAEPADFGLVVHADCTVESRDAKHGKRPASGPLPRLRFLHEAAGDEVALIDTGAAFDLVDVKRSEDMPAGSFMAFAWKVESNALTLRQIDDRRVATLIVQGAIQGTAQAKHHNRGTEIANAVEEDAAATANLFRAYDLFSDKPLEFKRVGEDAKALERALRPAAKKAKK